MTTSFFKKFNTILWIISGLTNAGSAYVIMDMRSRLDGYQWAGELQDKQYAKLRQDIETSDARSLKAYDICEDVDEKSTLAIQMAVKTFCQVNPKVQECKEFR